MAKHKPLSPCGRPLDKFLVSSKDGKTTQLPTTVDFAQKLQEYSEKHRLNQSQARTQILEVILKEDTEHFTASQLSDKVRKRFPGIGAATVYRNLPIFVSAGILRESLADDKGQLVFELESSSHHDHLVCLDCDQIFEFHDPEIEAKQQKILKSMKFEENSHRHVIYAHCEFRRRNEKE